MATVNVTIESEDVLLVLGIIDNAILEGTNNLEDMEKAKDISSWERTFTLNSLDALKRLREQIRANAP
jgi:hypothetical protein